ncbi:MAG: vWA domain-containing protein [Polyangiaceae bacterium]
MSKVRARFGLPLLVAAGLGVGACGGSNEPTNVDGNGGSANDAFDPALVSDDPVGTNAACVTSLKSATLPTVNLVMMVDKSGSMGNPAEGGDPKLKWLPVTAGMKSFFHDAASAGYAASLQFFPAPGSLEQTCGAAYDAPLVPLTPLAGSAPLVAALDAAKPQGGTPTLPALEGALAFAKRTVTAHPDEKSAVVLVTDGEPGLMVNGSMQPGCTQNDVSHVAAAAAAAAKGTPAIPTYVIGVGPALSKLDTIAAAGGTGKAYMISVADPTQTTTELQQALDAIRGAEKVSCDFALPAPPPGQRLDPKRVNVAVTAASGQVTPLVYSRDCSATNGWRYDDLNAPTRVELCTATCGSVQSDAKAKLAVAFGCATNGVPR